MNDPKQQALTFFKCVFPDGMNDYPLLNFVLRHYGDMSYRQIAQTLAYLKGGFYMEYLEDAEDAETFEADETDADNLWKCLLDCGFKEWNG